MSLFLYVCATITSLKKSFKTEIQKLIRTKIRVFERLASSSKFENKRWKKIVVWLENLVDDIKIQLNEVVLGLFFARG